MRFTSKQDIIQYVKDMGRLGYNLPYSYNELYGKLAELPTYAWRYEIQIEIIDDIDNGKKNYNIKLYNRYLENVDLVIPLCCDISNICDSKED